MEGFSIRDNGYQNVSVFIKISLSLISTHTDYVLFLCLYVSKFQYAWFFFYLSLSLLPFLFLSLLFSFPLFSILFCSILFYSCPYLSKRDTSKQTDKDAETERGKQTDSKKERERTTLRVYAWSCIKRNPDTSAVQLLAIPGDHDGEKVFWDMTLSFRSHCPTARTGGGGSEGKVMKWKVRVTWMTVRQVVEQLTLLVEATSEIFPGLDITVR